MPVPSTERRTAPTDSSKYHQLSKMMRFLASLFLLGTLIGLGSAGVTDDCLACMCFVSSVGCKMPTPTCNDNGYCGPYSISEPYWKDAGYRMGSVENCAADWTCSKETVKAYLLRYVTDSKATCEVYARTHFGGPSGSTGDWTLDYWYQVSNCMDYNLFTPPPTQE